MVKPGTCQREEHRTKAQLELKTYWDRVLMNTARVIEQMTVPQLVRLASDEIFSLKTGCDYLEKHENTMDLHVNKLIRIVVEEKINDYLRTEEQILRESRKVARKLDRLLKIKEANRLQLTTGSQVANTGDTAASEQSRSTTKRFSDCIIM